MKISVEQTSKLGKACVNLQLTADEAVTLAQYLADVRTTKPQRGVLNPDKLGQNLCLFADWLTDGIEHG